MALISLAAGSAASFLPETAGTDLPETVAEAGDFGSDQKYFQWIRPRLGNSGRKEEKDGEETIPL